MYRISGKKYNTYSPQKWQIIVVVAMSRPRPGNRMKGKDRLLCYRKKLIGNVWTESGKKVPRAGEGKKRKRKKGKEIKQKRGGKISICTCTTQ